MALFTNKDDMRLPRSTQIYQADTENLAAGDVKALYERWKSPTDQPLDAFLEASLAKGFKLLRAIMDDIVSEKGIRPEVKAGAFSWLKDFQQRLVFTDETLNEHGRYNLAFIEREITGFKIDVLTVLACDMYEIIFRSAIQVKEQGHQKLLRRCDDCSSVFLVTRTDQQYCSERCRNRSSKRRVYAIKRKNTKNIYLAV